MKNIFFLTLAAITISGCSTVSKTASDHFRIDTVPQGARVTTTIETANSRKKRAKNMAALPEYVGCAATPCAIKIWRHTSFIATITHPGFEPAEVLIRNGYGRGSLSADMAVNVGTAVSSGVATGVLAAGMEIALTEMTNSVISVFSFNILPARTVDTAAITASSVSKGAGVGAGVGVGMIAVDLMTGANKNLYPNPVVLKLAPAGVRVKTDPGVAEFRAKKVKPYKTLTQQHCWSKLHIMDFNQKKKCAQAKRIDAQRAIKPQ